MKTKNTSDSLCLERIKNSTLPFAMDDPKNLDDIQDLVIQLCNRKLTGNLCTGLHRPRSITLFCCNFGVGSIRRFVITLVLGLPPFIHSIYPTDRESGNRQQLVSKFVHIGTAQEYWSYHLKSWLWGLATKRMWQHSTHWPKGAIIYHLQLGGQLA